MDEDCKAGLWIATWIIALLLVLTTGISGIITATGRISHDWDCSNHGGAVNLGETRTVTIGATQPVTGQIIQVVCKDGYRL